MPKPLSFHAEKVTA